MNKVSFKLFTLIQLSTGLGHTKLISCFWSACTCGSIFSELLDLGNRCNSIQHSTTVFTQPVLNGFTIQASIFWLPGYTRVCILWSCPQTSPSTMHYAVCTPFSLNFGFRKKKRKKKSLVAWSFFSDL